MQIEARDLDKQSLEHAAADQESSALSWIGRVMVAPQARSEARERVAVEVRLRLGAPCPTA